MEEPEVVYFDVPYAIKVHDAIIEISGGRPGHNPDKIQLLESILGHIQNADYYPTFLDKITHLLYSINKGHVFTDGNKRSSLALSAYFLEVNGYDYCVEEFILRMENIVVWVADNKVDKDLLKEIIEDIILMRERESVKIALINILSQSDDI